MKEDLESIEYNNSLCERLHRLCREAKKYQYPIVYEKLPLNGIILVFEKDEVGHDGERIVMVGSHTGENRLRLRIEEHYDKQDKFRSILRKHIGCALLKQAQDVYLDVWKKTKKQLQECPELFSEDKEKCVEDDVSQYIQQKMSFVVIKVDDAEKRKELKKKIASTISKCTDCASSSNWLGSSNPENKIAESGLWQVQGLYKDGLTEEDLKYIKQNII